MHAAGSNAAAAVGTAQPNTTAPCNSARVNPAGCGAFVYSKTNLRFEGIFNFV